MRSDFKKMEEEMEHLAVSMGEITEFNEKVNLAFKDRREEITRLKNTDNLLKKVFFLNLSYIDRDRMISVRKLHYYGYSRLCF